ncbi:unnamed protein product [Prorocentrum cordatum]|uniref:EF-hand domain-containing protein n=1 Tax=Prorocentrum cordatum TaxID=2364126 RepID=A0ABN9XNI7_9DINO|nr:unnamed protein product [Polarella glacialis]
MQILSAWFDMVNQDSVLHTAINKRCPRCDAPEEDDLHRFWTCPALQQCTDEATLDSNHLVLRAVEHIPSYPIKWGRAFQPAEFTTGKQTVNRGELYAATQGWDTYNIQPWALLANSLADEVANGAATHVQLPQTVLDSIDAEDAEMQLVSRRLATIQANEQDAISCADVEALARLVPHAAVETARARARGELAAEWSQPHRRTELRRFCEFSDEQIAGMQADFLRASGGAAALGFPPVRRALGELGAARPLLSAAAEARLVHVIADRGGSGDVDFRELCCLLSCLCLGAPQGWWGFDYAYHVCDMASGGACDLLHSPSVWLRLWRARTCPGPDAEVRVRRQRPAHRLRPPAPAPAPSDAPPAGSARHECERTTFITEASSYSPGVQRGMMFQCRDGGDERFL